MDGDSDKCTSASLVTIMSDHRKVSLAWWYDPRRQLAEYRRRICKIIEYKLTINGKPKLNRIIVCAGGQGAWPMVQKTVHGLLHGRSQYRDGCIG